MKKILALILALILVVAMCACNSGNGDGTTATTTAPATEGDTTAKDDAGDETTVAGDDTTAADDETTEGDDIIEDEEPIYLDEALYLTQDVVNPQSANGATFGLVAQKLAPGESVSTKFTITQGEIAGIKIGCPSWNDSNGTLTLAIYRWVEGEGKNEKAALQDGYAKTIASEPILSQTFENFSDNETLALYLDALGLGEGGTYLAILSNPGEEDLGVGYQKSSFDGRTYYGALKYQLPDDLADYGYDPQFTTDVTAFSTTGVPATKGYANFVVEVLLPADFVIEE